LILLNDFKRQWAETGADVMQAVQAVGESGWFILGQSVKDFETDLARFWGLPHAIGVASGLDAIELSLRAMGCGPGEFVLTSPISAFATPLAILKTGATPVFADSDSYGLIDLEECREILKARPEIKYFIPVHLYGHSLDAGALASIRDEFGVQIIEDCAQSIGAKHNGVMTGATGRMVAASFYPTTNLGALGDGGAVLAKSGEDAEKIRQLRDYGQSSKYRHEVIGYNSRLDELQAAIMKTAFLPRLPKWTDARRSLAAKYLKNISSPGLKIPGIPKGSESCWHLFPVLVEKSRKAEAMAHFKAKGVQVAEHYPLALIEQPALDPCQGKLGSNCDRAKEFCHRELSLPIHPYLTDDEAAQVIAACNAWR